MIFIRGESRLSITLPTLCDAGPSLKFARFGPQSELQSELQALCRVQQYAVAAR